MPEFLTLLPPQQARQTLFAHLPPASPRAESLPAADALGRVSAADILAPHPLPEFPRTTVDGYAVRAGDTFGAGDSLPAYLTLLGEVPMGAAPDVVLKAGTCALIHTGGMLPEGADAVVMVEYTQTAALPEIEIFKAVAVGENVIQVGEDVALAQQVMPAGTVLRPAEIGGLMALGITRIEVAQKPRVALISTGDEVIPPGQTPRPGQVRDVNSYTLAALVQQFGGMPVHYGIIGDHFPALQAAAQRALAECDLVLITAGSSASTRDMTAAVIQQLGNPGVLVHGINTRPGKPTILGVCNGKAVIGLPGNPVSALVNGYLFVAPLIQSLLGQLPKPLASVRATLTVNLPSQAGREDWWPVRLVPQEGAAYQAHPIFGKSNLIFNLAAAHGLLSIPPDATGLSAGAIVEVILL